MNSPRVQIPDSFIQDVLARADIVDVVGRHVSLKKGGANLLGLCPFHGEKSPSFTVSPAKQFYHCFGCGAHGDAIRFVMEHSGLGFVDAVRELGQQVGLKLPEATLDPAEQAKADAAQTRRRGIHEVLERAAEHYRLSLKATPRAVDYLKRRGLSGEVARDFGLGYAPDGWRSLAGVFPDYADPVLGEAGLVITHGEDGADQKRYDRFRDRIMFPIRSTKGELIGFGGRVIDAGEPKYLNSPETPVFVKGRELYGLYEGRSAIRERGHALVVEGYMDVVALAQAGFGQAVATLGTACTPDHVQKLLRFTDHVVFSFDGDAAGRRAATRALEAALPHVSDLRSFRFLFLPPEHDPDSYVRERGAAAFEAEIAGARPLSRHLADVAAEGVDLATAEGRARFLAQARPLWSALPEGALRTQILGELALAARLELDQLHRLWRTGGGSRTAPDRRPPGDATARRAPAARLVRQSIRLPQDNVAHILLLDSRQWLAIGPQDQELLRALEGWHAELFAWLDRELTEHGHREWPELREALGELTFADAARRLVDEAAVPATSEELPLALQQTRQARARREVERTLGRSG
ncbi:MAG: DNA primase [Rubrivivax sp.]|nr:DNA primase [Rubrivivax sp.]